MSLPGIVAHRGASGELTENTLEAIELGWQQGADAVEVDVQVTADGVAVVFHDHTTARFGGDDASINSLSRQQLRSLAVEVPDLAQVLDMVPAGKDLFLDVKCEAKQFAAVADVVSRSRSIERVSFEAFAPATIEAIGQRFPTMPLYWLVVPMTKANNVPLPYPPSMPTWLSQPVAGCSLDFRAVDAALADALQKRGWSVVLWTINNESELADALTLAPRWIETDFPKKLVEALPAS